MSRLSILVVEDDFLIAMGLEDFLIDEGHEVVGTSRSLSSAFQILEDRAFDVAILDIDLGSELVWPFARRLSQEGRDFFFLSSDCTRRDFPSECSSAQRLCKPFKDEEVRLALSNLTGLKAA